jgi:ketosteroid isomerase-like protein
MSQENARPPLEVFKRAYLVANEAFNRQDFEAAFASFDPDFVWETIGGAPGPERTQGRPGTIDGFRELIAEFPDWHVEPQEFIEAPEAILVRNIGTATGGKSGVPVRQRFTQVWSFRNGRPARVREFVDHAEALEAAGLREPGAR